MLAKLKKLNRSNKIWLFLLALLFVAVVVAAIQHKNTVTTTSNATQVVDNTDSNLDDTTNPDTTAAPQNAATPTPQEATNAQCHVNGSLPDSACTPGATDPRVTQSDIKQTICVSGYTKTVRPSSSITSEQKKVSMQQYGFTDSPSNYEYDHLISLELGGAPDDTKNLWPEPGASPNPKDKVENKLHSLVCSGAMQLAEAQNRIATNWTTALSGY